MPLARNDVAHIDGGLEVLGRCHGLVPSWLG
jgi:hypothetical protein